MPVRPEALFPLLRGVPGARRQPLPDITIEGRRPVKAGGNDSRRDGFDPDRFERDLAAAAANGRRAARLADARRLREQAEAMVAARARTKVGPLRDRDGARSRLGIPTLRRAS